MTNINEREHIAAAHHVAFRFDLNGRPVIAFADDDLLSAIAVESAEPLASFEENRDKLIAATVRKFDADDTDDAGNVHLRLGDLPPTTWPRE